MSRMPCSITDDPYSDYSDYIEQKGVYKPYVEPDEDAAYEEERQKEIDEASKLD